MLIHCSAKLIVNLLHQKKSADCDVEDKKKGQDSPKKFEDVELQALLDEDDAQNTSQLVRMLFAWQKIYIYILELEWELVLHAAYWINQYSMA